MKFVVFIILNIFILSVIIDMHDINLSIINQLLADGAFLHIIKAKNQLNIGIYCLSCLFYLYHIYLKSEIWSISGRLKRMSGSNSVRLCWRILFVLKEFLMQPTLFSSKLFQNITKQVTGAEQTKLKSSQCQQSLLDSKNLKSEV